MKTERKRPLMVVVSGAESTGKSVLTSQLSQLFNGRYFPEYAREYLETHGTAYTYQDVENIAAVQREQMEQALDFDVPVVFFDTWLIITSVWFEVVYGRVPGWIPEAIRKAPVDLFLLCANDIPWVPDPLRENGGEKRAILFERYKSDIVKYGFEYQVVNGTGEQRLQNAARQVAILLR